MNATQFLKGALFATAVAYSSGASAQDVKPTPDKAIALGEAVAFEGGCVFNPTSPDSPVHLAIVITEPVTKLGFPFEKNDVLYDFGQNEEYVVRGKLIRNLPDTNPTAAIARMDVFQTLTDIAPVLQNKCATAQAVKYRGLQQS